LCSRAKRPLADESGMALVMSLSVMMVLSILTT
jgi:Tfp pilus assembly protein PilX